MIILNGKPLTEQTRSLARTPAQFATQHFRSKQEAQGGQHDS